MSIEALKAKARTLEQKEDWSKALEQYRKAIDLLEEEGSPDIALYNRVGDLYVRVENFDAAVHAFDRAVDLYVEAELHNNAIAVCKKIIRHVPSSHAPYLRIGQVRAHQGFISDAKTNFLLYAERVQKDGDLDESLRALVEFCDLAPDEVEMRLAVAEQLASRDRKDEAVRQYVAAYHVLLSRGENDMAAAVEGKARALDPGVELGEAVAAVEAATSAFDDPFADIIGVETGSSAEEFSIETPAEEAAAEEEAVELPTVEFAAEEAAEEEAVELPTMGFAAEEEGEEEPAELPIMEFPADEAEAGVGELAETGEMAEVDLGLGDAAAAREEAMEEAAAEKETGGGDFVDFGSMVLGEKSEKSTRLVVDYEEPSGDEEADFARMLSQFKEKISESLDADDVKAHHDLGTAYKEMGLLDEAVGEFQAALRASSDHLPTYELLGQTFMEMGKPDAAAKSLQRALQVPHDVEDDLVGIYYHLARALEDLGQSDKAVDFYDRVFALDINFADVTERLRALRPS